MSLFNQLFPPQETSSHQNTVGSWTVSRDRGSVLRRVLVPRASVSQTLISHRSSERWSPMPPDRRQFGDLKKPRCAALSLSLWRFLQQPLHHCHAAIHPGMAPAIRTLHEGRRVMRGLFVATKEPVRDALEDRYRCRDIQMYKCAPLRLRVSGEVPALF